MSRTYPIEYFENQVEQSQIEAAILKAIPDNIYYHNLIIVLAKLIKDFCLDAFKDEVFTKSAKNKRIEENEPA